MKVPRRARSRGRYCCPPELGARGFRSSLLESVRNIPALVRLAFPLIAALCALAERGSHAAWPSSTHCRRIRRRPAGVRVRGLHHDFKHGNLMRRLLATMPNCAPALLALFVIPLSPDTALSDSLGSGTVAPATPAALACTSNDVVVYEPNPSPGSEPACAAPTRRTAEVAEARAYVIETASPGFTMTLQGAELAIGRLPNSSSGSPTRSGRRAARDCRSLACSRPIDHRHSASAASPTNSTRCTPTGLPST